MKNSTLLLVATLSVSLCYGQSTNNLFGYKNGKPAGTSHYMKCSSFHVSKPLSELAHHKITNKGKEPEPLEQVGKGVYKGQKPAHKSYPPDPVIQHKPGSLALDTQIVNVEGINWNYRPDASIAAGPNNVVQAVNLGNFAIYDKAGNMLASASIEDFSNDSASDDPIVLYDKFADRWVLTDVTNNYTSLTVAVSTSPNPAGSYYVYTFLYPVMPDFPKYSIWTDGYYATYRDINLDTVGISVFDRDGMLKGSPGAGVIIAAFPNAHVINQNSQLPASPKILTCDGALPPYGSPAYLMYYTNVNMGDPSNSIMIYKLSTDTTHKTCTLTFVDSLATAPYDGYFAGYSFGGNISEPGGQWVWSLEGPLQYRVPYIRFTGYSSVVLCNTVNLGDSIGGIRWYEIRQNDTTSKWSIYQQGTFGPSDSVNRWNASICEDMNDDIALMYDVSNSTTLYPGIRYTGRLAGDPLGQMTFAEQTAMNGTQSFNQQWGDYAQSTLDPDGITFWNTSQYIIDPTGSIANTRVFSFRLSNSAAGINEVTKNNAKLEAYQSGNYLNVIASGLPSGEKIVLNLFDINGKQITSQWLTPVANGFESRMDISTLAKGIYLVRTGNSGFQKVVKVVIE